MDYFLPLSLPPSLRPVLLATETLHVVQKDVGLYEGKKRLQEYDNGIAMLTSHRLCWIDEVNKRAIAVGLESVGDIETSAGLWKASSPKVTITLRGPKPRSAASGETSSPVAAASSPIPEWTCPICDNRNLTSDVKCSLCGVPAPASVQVTAASPSASDGPAWICQICDARNASIQDKCETCGVPKSADAQLEEETANGLACPACTFKNADGLTQCEMCGTSLPTRTQESLENWEHLEGVSVMRFSFRAGGHSEFAKALHKALQGKVWEKVVESPKPTAIAGLSHIMRTAETNASQASSVLNEAFADLNALMAKASEMVQLSQSISTKLAQSPGHTDDEQAFRNMVVELGVRGPITKETAGDSYTTELARQLSNFLDKLMNREVNGYGPDMMSVLDVWCLFNRARSVDMISPEDLLRTLDVFPRLHLPYTVRRFASGLLAVTRSTHTDAHTVQRVLTAIRDSAQKNLTDVEFAQALGCSVVLAREEMLLAESRGAICRDDSLEGIRFWENMILRA
ncbi:EAP30/Vps36 family-domain-containing protein [Gaertneriomyces semiglobifer]|nr:EAP30/Vps36 family-domain-containing protein [Gaertneriomyces semiglobifer]